MHSKSKSIFNFVAKDARPQAGPAVAGCCDRFRGGLGFGRGRSCSCGGFIGCGDGVCGVEAHGEVVDYSGDGLTGCGDGTGAVDVEDPTAVSQAGDGAVVVGADIDASRA